MKKLIIAIAAAFIAVSASAQVGIIAGITSQQSNYKEAWAHINEVTQYHVGATLKLPLPFGLAVQPSIIYDMKGSSIETAKTEGVETALGTVDTKTGFLEVPVQVQFGIPIAGVVRPYVFAEPYVGIAINGEEKINIAGLADTENKQEWENVKDRLTYGFGVGAGVELLQHLQVSVRYFWTLGGLYGQNEEQEGKTITASTNPKDYIEIAQNQKCNGVMASIAFLF